MRFEKKRRSGVMRELPSWTSQRKLSLCSRVWSFGRRYDRLGRGAKEMKAQSEFYVRHCIKIGAICLILCLAGGVAGMRFYSETDYQSQSGYIRALRVQILISKGNPAVVAEALRVNRIIYDKQARRRTFIGRVVTSDEWETERPILILPWD